MGLHLTRLRVIQQALLAAPLLLECGNAFAGGFEIRDPVVNEADPVWLAKAIQLVEPDQPLGQSVSEVLEEELESTRRAKLEEACRVGSGVPHGVGDPARLQPFVSSP